ncbi:MAG: hypothetical protein E6G35_16700 [Actinobacteria bacterium]|nr:MAG: hypothetical protein E6G35_16700 [Actinomycetota bacterium]
MSWHNRRKLSIVTAVAVVAALTPLAGASTASAAPAGRFIHKTGTAAYRPTPTGTGAPASLSTEIRQEAGPDAASRVPSGSGSRGSDRSLARQHGARAGSGQTATSAAAPSRPSAITRGGPQLLASFDGMNHRSQRTANGGNQFSIEPPDQGLCVGGGHVVEALNDVFRVYSASGTPQTGVIDLNTFFGYPAQFVRPSGPFGPEVTDPTCLYDPTTRTFFLVVLTLDVDPASGDLLLTNHLDIAVAQDPLGTWTKYSLDSTDNGNAGSPVHPHCPCLGDYPHIGVDSHGFYITTNEYPWSGPVSFNSAQIYAFSKRAFARGDADIQVTQFDTTGLDKGEPGFTVWPAQSPTAGQYSHEADGTEYFLSSNAAPEATGVDGSVSNTIVTWALSDTESLDSASPNPRLTNTRVHVTPYALPPLSNQKVGPFPLGQCLTDPACSAAFGLPNKAQTESPLDSNDTRMQQVTYANGKLYGALDTVVTVEGRKVAGVGWYIVSPDAHPHSVSAHLANQGQLALAGANLTYPAIGLNADGKGVMAFTLVGDNYYPSAAYAAFDGRTGAGSIFVAKAGVGPQDGFTGYDPLGGSPARPRWGDYGATAVDGGNIWIASEYIGQSCDLATFEADPSCGLTRTLLANWDTRISLIKP